MLPAVPVFNQYEPKQHTSQVRKVGHIASGLGYTQHQLKDAVENHEILSFDGYGREKQQQLGIGKEHAES